MNAIWDENRSPITHLTLLDIKGRSSEGKLSEIWRLKSTRILVVNTVTNKAAGLLGKDETAGWVNLAIFSGTTRERESETVLKPLGDREVRDPTLFCTGYKRQRFHMFTRSEPE